MSLERFHVPKTPESRTPYVLGLLAILAAIRFAWSALVDFRFSVAILIAAAGAAIAYAVWRYVRQRT